MSTDERLEELERRLEVRGLAVDIVRFTREDSARTLTAAEHANAFHHQPEPWFGTTFPEQTIDIPKLFEFLAQLVCPPPCVGFVNATGWHQLCEGKAQEAIRALGFPVPDLTPIPDEGVSA